jgi:trigger factor
MQVKKSQLTPTSVQLTFNAHEADLSPIKQAAVKKLGGNVKLAGFRPGKAPQSLIEKNLDPTTLESEVIEEAINHFYAETMRKEQIRPVSQPKVDIKKFVPFTTLEVEVTVDILGPITLPDYKKMKIERPKISVTAADISEVLKTLQERAGEKKDVDRPAKVGDNVMIDFKGTDAKGEAVNGAEGKDYPLLLGSNSFIPGFEDNLLGLKPGAQKTFTLKFPKDYGVKALANKDVTFEITVNKVQAVELPKLDDDFAKSVGPFQDLKGLKDDIKKELTNERQQTADRDFQNQVLEKITEKAKLEVPNVLIEEQLDAAEREERQNLMYRGQTWEEHLAAEGKTEAEHRESHRSQAELRVKAGLVLSEISSKEEIMVTPQELDERIAELKTQYQDAAMQAELEKPENRQDIGLRLLSEKTINKLVDYVTKG